MEILTNHNSLSDNEQILKTIDKLQQEKDKLAALVVEMSLKLQTTQSSSNYGKNAEEGLLFCDFMKSWLKSREHRLSPNTTQEYNKVLLKHIYPYFKEKRILIYDLTSEDIEEYYAVKILQGLSPNTVLKHHANIFSALKYACSKNIILYSPMKDVERPSAIKFTPNYYSPQQLQILFKAAKGSELYTPILLAAMLGLRRSEIVGLMWDCINFHQGTITIKRKAIKLKGSPEDTTCNKLKTQSSYRTLSLPPILFTYLQDLRKWQEQAVKSDPLYNSKHYRYVCVNSKGNRLTLQYITDAFRRFVRSNGLDIIRFHDLRHSCATMLLHFGYNTKQIQEWLGHSDIKTTLGYTHLYSTDKSKMANKISETFKIEL